MDEAVARGDLLMEAAERQQRQAESAVERLNALAQGLDEVVRDEVRAAFAEEFRMLGAASERAAQALHSVRRVASVRVALWAVGVTAACSLIPIAVAWTVLPARGEVAQMRRERDELAASIARLREQGGRIDLRRCGPGSRVCVRVDRSAPAYGVEADYLVVKGY